MATSTTSTTSTSGSAPERTRVPAWALWFGLFGAPTIWSAQLIAGYAFDAHGCFPSTVPLSHPTFGGLWLLQFLIGLLSLAVSAAAGLVAWRSWRTTSAERDGTAASATHRGRVHFMAFSGILVSTLFLYGVLLNWVPLFIVPVCS